jgi:hypothetical protein
MSDQNNNQNKAESHVLLWSLVTALIVFLIGAMWAADYLYAPEMINPATLPDAVGK